MILKFLGEGELVLAPSWGGGGVCVREKTLPGAGSLVSCIRIEILAIIWYSGVTIKVEPWPAVRQGFLNLGGPKSRKYNRKYIISRAISMNNKYRSWDFLVGKYAGPE
jgi:hypothetical protein